MSNNLQNGSVHEIVKFAKASHQRKPSQDLPYSEGNTKEADLLLLEPYSHILAVPGKNIRGKLIKAFNHWLEVPEEKIDKISEIIKLLHNASLLLDDIEDSSILRRGQPVAHLIYGQASTINCANYVMFIGLEKCLALGHPQATAVFTQQLLELHRGQGMEIYWRDNFQCPSEEEYNLMISRKTGGLFNLAVRLMQLFSTNEEDFTELLRLMGLYFQIRDDYMNLTSEDYATNKSFAEDLTEGKFSYPILHAVRSNERDDRVLKILRQRTHDVDVKKFCIKLIADAGSFEYTKETLRKLEQDIKKEISRLGDNQYLSVLLDELSNWN